MSRFCYLSLDKKPPNWRSDVLSIISNCTDYTFNLTLKIVKLSTFNRGWIFACCKYLLFLSLLKEISVVTGSIQLNWTTSHDITHCLIVTRRLPKNNSGFIVMSWFNLGSFPFTQLACHFNRRTAEPLGASSPPGCDAY